MYSVILLINLLAGAGVIGLVLIQHGKGADMGAAFGSGSSGSLFGATGSSNFLSKATGVLAAVFIITCLSLNYMVGTQTHAATSVVDSLKDQPVQASDVPTSTAPAANERTQDIPK